MGFKTFEDKTIDLNEGVSILVGDNDAGKSTVLEAIHLALTGNYRGRSINSSISEDLFNREMVSGFFEALDNAETPDVPRISIQVTFGGSESVIAEYSGDFNEDHRDLSGVRLDIELNSEEFEKDFWDYVRSEGVEEIPVEYFHCTRRGFCRTPIFQRKFPFRSNLVDSTGFNRQVSSRNYATKNVREFLPEERIVKIAQSHRKALRRFNHDKCIVDANSAIASAASSLTSKKVSFAASKGTKDEWEKSIETRLDDIVLENAGAGSQSIVTIELSLRSLNSDKKNLILLEEPECHLSHSSLNMLLNDIALNNDESQIVVCTHSSFVANKLMLDNIIWLGEGRSHDFRELSSDTSKFFSKVAGYDTLRLMLCRAAVLVEGDSDELVFQKLYKDSHDGKLPIENGVDVISVGTSFLRFLELAERADCPVVAIADNDGDLDAVRKKYEGYKMLGDAEYSNNIEMHDYRLAVSFPNRILPKGDIEDYSYNTLEPEIYETLGIETINAVLDKDFETRDDALKYMKGNKTECALRIFDYKNPLSAPPYMELAIKFLDSILAGSASA